MRQKLKEFFRSKLFAMLTIGAMLSGAILGLLDHFFLKSVALGNFAGFLVFIPMILIGIILAFGEYEDKTSAQFLVPLGFVTVVLFGGVLITSIFFPLEQVGLSREAFRVALSEWRILSFQIMAGMFVVLAFLRIVLKSFGKLLPSFE